jgi:hypothetical protein
MARQPFIGRRAWRTPEGWSVCFRTHQGRFATVVTSARTRGQALRIADILERRELIARRALAARAAEERRS